MSSVNVTIDIPLIRSVRYEECKPWELTDGNDDIPVIDLGENVDDDDKRITK